MTVLAVHESSRTVSARTVASLPVLFRCPQCSGRFQSASDYNRDLVCTACRFVMAYRDNIWHALPRARGVYYSQFIQNYEAIRAAEGRGSADSSYYLQLPHLDASHSNAGQWKIRARSYEHLASKIFPKIFGEPGARVLDIGAGNCWLSYRLAQIGMRPIAVDLLVNTMDGLGAGWHYDSHLKEPFLRIQADYNTLPFEGEQFDAVIFNASFHYAENFAITMSEALRCVKSGGAIIVMDSPWYSCEQSGIQMLSERRSIFNKRFGTPSDSLQSEEFLTDAKLDVLARTLRISWERFTPSYGLSWAFRPWLAKIKGRREPATFRIYLAKKPA